MYSASSIMEGRSSSSSSNDDASHPAGPASTASYAAMVLTKRSPPTGSDSERLRGKKLDFLSPEFGTTTKRTALTGEEQQHGHQEQEGKVHHHQHPAGHHGVSCPHADRSSYWRCHFKEYKRVKVSF